MYPLFWINCSRSSNLLAFPPFSICKMIVRVWSFLFSPLFRKNTFHALQISFILCNQKIVNMVSLYLNYSIRGRNVFGWVKSYLSLVWFVLYFYCPSLLVTCYKPIFRPKPDFYKSPSNLSIHIKACFILKSVKKYYYFNRNQRFSLNNNKTILNHRIWAKLPTTITCDILSNLLNFTKNKDFIFPLPIYTYTN